MSDLVESLQTRQLPQPNQRTFDLEEWLRAADELDLGDDDLRVFKGGLWVFYNLKGIRDILSNIELDFISSDTFKSVQSGIVNYEYLVATSELEKSLQEPTDDSTIQRIKDVSVDTTLGTTVPAIEGIESSVDTLEMLLRWIDIAHDCDQDQIDWQEDVPESLYKVKILGELYDTHEQYWLEILWNGWDVRFGDDISLLMSPGDKKDKVRASSYARYEKLNVEQSLRLGSMLRDTSEPLEDLVNPPTWNVSVTWMDDELVLQAYRDDYSQEHRMNVRAARFAAAEFYLMELLTEPLPQVNGQTLDQVMDAWELLAGLARSLKSMFMSRLENLPSDQPLSIDDLAYFSPQIPARQLVYLIHDCLNFSLASAESIINLFTFDEGCSRDKSIWTSPLVSVGDGKLVPVILPLISPLMLRIVQDWAKLGGMTLEKKGTEYEKSLESGLSRSIESSDTIEDAQVYENIKTVEFNGEQEEIDILFRLGNKIFVCEAKAPIVPQEPLQIHNHFERLSKACRQADRKSGFVRKNLDQLHEQYDFSYPINELEIHPLVLTSMPIGVGWSDLNVPVIDRYILFRYFDTGGRIQSTAYSEQGFDTKKAETYYESEEEAVGRIIEYLNEPPTLYNLFQGLEYDIKAIPNVEDRKVVKAQLKVDWEKVVK